MLAAMRSRSSGPSSSMDHAPGTSAMGGGEARSSLAITCVCTTAEACIHTDSFLVKVAPDRMHAQTINEIIFRVYEIVVCACVYFIVVLVPFANSHIPGSLSW